MNGKLVDGNGESADREESSSEVDCAPREAGTRREVLAKLAKFGGMLAAIGLSTSALGARNARAAERTKLSDPPEPLTAGQATISVSIQKLQTAGILKGNLGAGDHSFTILAGKGDQKSASTHGPERRKADRPVCDCDDD